MTPAHADINYDALDREDEERRARLTSPGALADAARWYAGNGWPVFPLKPGGKTPATAHGFKDASTDLEQVNAWWQQTPQANIGIPTGVLFDVVDVDGPDGYRSLADMWHVTCPPGCCATTTCHPDRSVLLGHPVLAVAYTGGGGRHILIPRTGQGNGTKLSPGIDYRGDGGYIVLPPSRHPSGRLYEWINPPGADLLGQVAA